MSDSSKKDLRRQKLANSQYKKEKVSEEQRFISKSKKQLKKQVEDMRAEELWEDWEDEVR
ncbi:MAG: hypothetical protein ACKO7N_04555 [Candidatus Nitrosotenuis sp.]